MGELTLPSSGEPERPGTNALLNETGNIPSNEILRVSINLIDGSSVMGEPLINDLPFNASVGEFKLQLKLLDRISFSDDRKSAIASFQNGDRLEGSIGAEKIDIRTLFGRIVVPVAQIGSIAIYSGSLSAILRKGCVLYFSFDKDENGKVTDLSGNNHEGIVHDAQWVAAGRKGGAFSFNGRSSYIQVEDAPDLSLPNAMTLLAWVKTSKTDGWPAIIVKGHFGERNYNLMMPDDRGNLLDFHYMSGGTSWMRMNSVSHPNDGKWHHVAAAWNGTSMWVCVDGILENTKIDVFTGTEYVPTNRFTGPMNVNNYPLIIGWTPPYKQYFKGLIDEIMIFNRALKHEEIKQLYDLQK